jgi:predicted nucleotidyltransferase
VGTVLANRLQLEHLAKVLDDWLAPAPKIPSVYLFGSRVRGDHRPDSDVDVRLFLDEWSALDAASVKWWEQENASDFRALKARLPGPLAIHREQSDQADAAIRKGIADPVLVVGRVVCVWTPPRRW